MCVCVYICVPDELVLNQGLKQPRLANEQAVKLST